MSSENYHNGDKGSPQEKFAAQDYSVPRTSPPQERFPFAAFFRRAPKISVTEGVAGQDGHERMVERIIRQLFKI